MPGCGSGPDEPQAGSTDSRRCLVSIRGYPVAVPLEPQEYDLLVTFPSGVRRLQVKSTTYRGVDGRWQVGIGRHSCAYERNASKVAYDPDLIDIFAVVNGDGDIYLIPIGSVAGKVSLVLDAYQPCRVGSAASLLE